MGNFLVANFAAERSTEAQGIFGAGIAAAESLKLQKPSHTLSCSWAQAAVFPRRKGPNSNLAKDERTGSWLLLTGICFHSSGHDSSIESFLLARFLEIGAERLAAELEGFFVVVIGDGRTCDTLVITDIVGSCHCFVRSCNEAVLVSASSLLLAGVAPSELDPTACQEFLNTGVIYEERTLHQEVRKVGPAAVVRIRSGRIDLQTRYWHVGQLAPESLHGKAAIASFGEGLAHSARRISKRFGRIVCDLTGGYDSRALLAGFMTAGVPVATTVSGPASSPDVVISRSLAEMFGLPHIHEEPTPLQSLSELKEALPLAEGEYDLIDYSRILKVHQSLSERFHISLNGSFGELARGYWWELLWPQVGARRPLDCHGLARKRFAVGSFDASLFPSETRLDLASHFSEVIERTNAGLSALPNTLQMDHAYLAMRMQRWQGRIGSSTNQLWPCLSPFLFRSVLEIMLQTSSALRQRSLLVREMLARFQPKLATFPLEHGYPAEPASWKNLHRFYPLATYYAGRVCSKIKDRTGLCGAAKTLKGLLPRTVLWQSEAVRELLEMVPNRLASLLSPATSSSFISRSKETSFAHDAQWARLLSLAIVVRELDESRKLQRRVWQS